MNRNKVNKEYEKVIKNGNNDSDIREIIEKIVDEEMKQCPLTDKTQREEIKGYLIYSELKIFNNLKGGINGNSN